LNPVVVGDVVGIKFINRAGWTIAAVRWITQFEEGGMEFGVQFLANMARSVWVQPVNSGTPQAKPGLLLTDDDGADSLLTQPSLFGEMRTFEIEAQGEISTVRATALIEKTPRFDVFYVSAC
jgi:cyclic-di-GMP-binding protein